MRKLQSPIEQAQQQWCLWRSGLPVPQVQAEAALMAIIARKVGLVYDCRCTTCGKRWGAEDEKGGEEGKKHKH